MSGRLPGHEPPRGHPEPGPGTAQRRDEVLHATCVAHRGRGLLILGRSGAGKSGLALQLMALGAALVSDDRVVLRLQRDGVIASAPPAIDGLIEARGVGLLHAAAHGPAPVCLVVDLDRAETDRLPPPRRIDLLGQSVPLLHRVDSPHFPPALLQYIAAGPREDG